MDIIIADKYKLNKFFLSLCGLWPDQNWKYISFIRTIGMILLLSGIFVQFTSFLSIEYSLFLMLTIFSYGIVPMIYSFKYGFLWTAVERIRYLLNHIHKDWNELINSDEFEIMNEYAEKSRLFTIAFAAVCYPSGFAVLLHQWLPKILDVIVPLNESREPRLSIIVNYFVDQNEYYYFIVTHLSCAIALGATTLIATETVFLLFIYHACGMFKLAGYRIERTVDENLLQNSWCRREVVLKGRLATAIETHNTAMEFTEYIFATFSGHYFHLACIGTLSATVNLLRLWQAVFNTKRVEDIAVSSLVVSNHVVYIFFINYVLQQVADHRNEIYQKTYYSKWYNAPIPIQKVILLFMQYCMVDRKIAFGVIIEPSLETFTQLTKMAVSYCMVLCSFIENN